MKGRECGGLQLQWVAAMVARACRAMAELLCLLWHELVMCWAELLVGTYLTWLQTE